MASTELERSYADIQAYKLPNDSEEQDRLDYQHSLIYAHLGRRTCHAELTNPHRILDIGCGTGRTTVDFAAQYPTAKIYGIDLTPVPESRRGPRPENVEYITGNVRDLVGNDARLEPASFDHVFSRLLVYGMRDWPGYVQTAAQLAAPGGWVEMQDLDIHICIDGEEGDRDPEWIKVVRDVVAEKGLDFDCGSNIAGYMRDAGLTDIKVERYMWPLGHWMQDATPESAAIAEYCGKWIAPMQFQFVKVLLGNDPRFSEDEVKRLQVQAYNSMQPTDKGYIPYVVTTGRKPAN